MSIPLSLFIGGDVAGFGSLQEEIARQWDHVFIKQLSQKALVVYFFFFVHRRICGLLCKYSTRVG